MTGYIMEMESMTDYTTHNTIPEILTEWEELTNELSQKEIALLQWKQIYEIKSNEIIEHTDFKELYGANNQKVRENHIRNELSDWYDIIRDLEFSINYITRRISFLRELVKCKRVILEVNSYE